MHCAESGEESSETESVHSLKCHISHEVNHLHEGLKHVSSVCVLNIVHFLVKVVINIVLHLEFQIFR